MLNYKLKDCTIYAFKSPLIEAMTYCLIWKNESLLVDAVYSNELCEFLFKQKVDKITILLTHGHYDHILGIPLLRENFCVTVVTSKKGPEVLGNPKKNLTAVANLISSFRKSSIRMDIKAISMQADLTMQDGTFYEWNGLHFKMVYTPGHSEDSVCYLVENKCLFTGDTLLQNEKATLRFPGGNSRDYIAYTQPLLEALPKDLIVFPGHGEEFLISDSIIFREKIV